MRVLVVGGTGFIGTNLLQSLAGNYQITVLASCMHNYIDPIDQVKYIEGDFSESSVVNKVFQDHQFEAVVILACSTHPRSSNQNIYSDFFSNIRPVIYIIELAVQYNVKKLIFSSSSGALYHNGIGECMETANCMPASAYAAGKLCIEGYLNVYSNIHSICSYSLRMSNPYGPYQNPYNTQGVIAVFLRQLLQKKMLTVIGNGSASKDFIYIDDVIHAFQLCLEKENDPGHYVINIASGHTISVNELIVELESVIGYKSEIKYFPQDSVDTISLNIDIKRAKQILGWLPTIDFNEGISRTRKWLNTIL